MLCLLYTIRLIRVGLVTPSTYFPNLAYTRLPSRIGRYRSVYSGSSGRIRTSVAFALRMKELPNR